MAAHLKNISACFFYAWKGSLSIANAWASVVGGVLLLVLLRLFGNLTLVLPDGIPGLVVGVVITTMVAWPAILLGRFFWAPYAILSRRGVEIETLRGQLSDRGVSAANRISNAMKIGLEESSEYERVTHFPNGLVRRIIYVGVHNEGDGYLSECAMKIVNVSPAQKSGRLPANLALDRFLQVGRTQFVPVIGFVEVTGGSEHAQNDDIIISVKSGGYNDEWTTLSNVGEADAYTITLEVSALECIATRSTFKVWVDSGRRLRMRAI